MAMKHTEARARFLSWKERLDLSHSEIGRALGISHTAVRAWCEGDAVPDVVYRPALRVLAGIPEASWETADERKRRADAIAGAATFARELKARSRRHGSKVTAAA